MEKELPYKTGIKNGYNGDTITLLSGLVKVEHCKKGKKRKSDDEEAVQRKKRLLEVERVIEKKSLLLIS